MLAAFRVASECGLTTIFLGGRDGGAARGQCDHEIIVPSHTTARVQEVHTLILHQWLEAIDSIQWREAPGQGVTARDGIETEARHPNQ